MGHDNDKNHELREDRFEQEEERQESRDELFGEEDGVRDDPASQDERRHEGDRRH